VELKLCVYIYIYIYIHIFFRFIPVSGHVNFSALLGASMASIHITSHTGILLRVYFILSPNADMIHLLETTYMRATDLTI
jgi:hypothetical protein